MANKPTTWSHVQLVGPRRNMYHVTKYEACFPIFLLEDLLICFVITMICKSDVSTQGACLRHIFYLCSEWISMKPLNVMSADTLFGCVSFHAILVAKYLCIARDILKHMQVDIYIYLLYYK